MDRIIRIKVDANQAKKEVDVLDDKMTGLGTKINGVAAAIAAAFATGVVAKFLNDSVTAARNFEASLSNLSAITGAVGKDLEFLRQTALEFGATTTLSASQAAEALKLVASAKPELLESGAALKEVTRQAILLAEAAGIDLASAASTVGNSLNQFGAGADQAARFVNVLAAGAKFGSSEIAQTAEALKNAGVAAASAGVTFEQTNAAVQVLAATGVAGAEAGTSLRNIFLKLDTDIDSNLRPSVVGLEKALQNLNRQNLTSTQLVEKFGLENIVAGRTLIDNVENLSKLTSQLTGTNTAFEQASTNTDNLNGDLKGLLSALEAVQIQIGSKFTGTLREFTQETTSLLQAVNGNEAALAEWGDTFQIVYNVALLVSSVITAKLVTATVLATKELLLTAAAALATKVQYDSMGIAIARTTVFANIGAVAMRGLTASFWALGGPLGVVLLAASAFMIFSGNTDITSQKTKELTSTNDLLTQSYTNLTEAQTKNARFQLTQRIQAIEAEQAAIQRTSDLAKGLTEEERAAALAFTGATAGVDELGNASAAAQSKVDGLQQEIDKLKGKLTELDTVSSGGSGAKGGAIGSVVEQAESGFEALKKINSEIDSLFSGGINLFNGSDSAGQNDEAAARINQSIAALKLETQTLGSELSLQQGIRQGFISQEQAQLDLQTANKIQQAITERELLLAEKTITDQQRLETDAAFNANLLAITQSYEEQKTEIARQQALTRMQIESDTQQTYLETTQIALGALTDLLGGSTGAVKALKLLQAGANAFQIYAASETAAALILATPPGPVLNPSLIGLANAVRIKGKISAGAVLAAGAASTFGGGGSSGGFSGGGGGSSSPATLPTQPQAAQTVQALEIQGLDEIRDELRNQDGMVSTRFVATILDKISDANRIRGEG